MHAAPTARPRALAALAERTFDLLVIGGGITGAGVARDAALRGLSVALVERDDFASGTSSRSSRLIHGGLRYLEHGYVHLVLEASTERRLLLRLAPHLVRPLPFTWPVYRGARVARWKLAAGLALYDALALFRNVGRHRRLSANEVARREPALARDGLVGGAAYFDAATDDARLTLANALGAAAAGAIVVNHAEARALTVENGRATGAVIVDRLASAGPRIAVSARAIVNATGPWTDVIRRLEDPAGVATVRGTKGAHVAVPRDRIGNRDALTLLSPIDGRVMFVLPAGTNAIIGTTDTHTTVPPDDVRASERDVRYLLESVNAFFPAARLTAPDVVSAWAGIRPLIASGFGDGPASASREHAIVRSARGVIAVTGGKLTTHRLMAAQVVDEVLGTLGRGRCRSPTESVPLPGGDIASISDEIALATADVGSAGLARHLVEAYGTGWRAVWDIATDDRALAQPLVPGLHYLRAELVHGVTREMACTLADLLVRRTHVAFETKDRGRAAATEAARIVAPLLRWSGDEITASLADYAREADRMFGIDPG